jgi:adenylate cyclase
LIARRISLFTGLYLFAFVFVHLGNLALGLDSVNTMDQARSWLLRPWTNPIGGGLLVVCLFFHICLGLRSLYLRNTLRLNAFDAFQLLLGLSIPLLLFPHMITLAALPALTGQHSTYEQVLAHFWIDNPWLGLRQIIGLMVVWLHSCMGLFIWMRLQSWWSSVSLFVYPTVVLLPTLAMLGFVEAGKEVIADRESATSSYQASPYGGSYSGTDRVATGSYDSKGGSSYSDSANRSESGAYGSSSDSSAYGSSGSYANKSANKSANSYANSGANRYANSDTPGSYGGDQNASSGLAADSALMFTSRLVTLSVYGYLALLALALLARAIRLYPARDRAHVRYGDVHETTVQGGTTLLEVSRLNDVPHASLCGGKGRCGTCQVAVLSGAENLTPATEIERRKLQQINAADNIRLACQARTKGGVIEVEPVLPGFVVADDMPHRRVTTDTGNEKNPPLRETVKEPLSVSDDQS